MKKIKIEDAIGMILGHDVTQIIPGKYKGARFKRGHRIKKEDIRSWEGEALVDSGATTVALPGNIANILGLPAGRKVQARYANGKTEEKETVLGLRVEIMGRSSEFEAVIEPEAHQILIGQIVLESLDLILDPKSGILTPRPDSPDMPVIELY